MHFAVHCDNRRQRTAAQASDPFEIKLTIGRGLAGGDSQTLLQLFKNLASAANVAGGSLAAQNGMPARGREAKLRIKRGYPKYFVGRYPQSLFQLSYRLLRQVADSFLYVLQDGDQASAVRGVFR